MRAKDFIFEKWSQKYKRSIDCSHPKGFSQRAHCRGRKKKGVAEGYIRSSDEILQNLTSAYRTCVKHRDSYTNFKNIQTVYELLRGPLMDGDIE